MKKTIIITIIILIISNIGYSQIYLDQIMGADTLDKIVISSVQEIYGSDTTYLQSYESLEIRNDSLCIVSGNCILALSFISENCLGLITDKTTGALEGLGSDCDTIIIAKRPNGANTYSIGNFTVGTDTLFNDVFIYLGEGLAHVSGDGTDTSAFGFALDLTLNDGVTIDFTQQQTAIFTAEVDTTIIATQNDISGFISNETDPIFTAWDYEYDSLINVPTLADLNYWNKTGLNLDYTDGNVGIGTATPSAKVDVLGNIISDGARKIHINPNGIGGNYGIELHGQAGGWIQGFNFMGSTGTNLGGFMAYGSDNTMNRFFIGKWGDEKVSILPTGNVGIGTTSPSAKLHVGGTLKYGTQGGTATTLSGLDASGIFTTTGVDALVADLNYWTLSGSDLYRTSKVAVNTTTLSTYADLIIGGKHIDFASTSNSSFIGRFAGESNTQTNQMGIGYEALRYATGGTSTGIGYQAGKNNTGASLMAIGHIVAPNNTGINNTFIGYLSAFNNTSGGLNLFAGSSSGYANTTGERNVMLGYNVGQLAGIDSDRCVYIGYESGQISGGDFNTGVGTGSLKNSTSNFNAGFGYGALSTTTGANSTGIGSYAGLLATGANNVFLGYGAGYNSTESNTLFIENTTAISYPLIKGNFSTNDLTLNAIVDISEDLIVDGNVGIGVTTPLFPLHVDGSIYISGTGTIVDTDNSGGTNSQFLGRDAGGIVWENLPADSDGQTLSISGSDLTITGGNTVDIISAVYSIPVGKLERAYSLSTVNVGTSTLAAIDFVTTTNNGGFTAITGNDKLIVPETGTYEFTFYTWVHANGQTDVDVALTIGGTTQSQFVASAVFDAANDDISMTFTGQYAFTINDEVGVSISNTSGSNTIDYDGSHLIMKRLY